MSDTRTIRDVLSPIACRRIGLDPDTVLERKCEACDGLGVIFAGDEDDFGDGCVTCNGLGWITVNRIVVVPVGDDDA